MAQQVPQHARAEHQRRQDPALPRPPVQREPRPGGDDAHARHLAGRAARPLAQRQVRHVMPVGREPLREVAIPALGAPDRVREQAVVDDADPHAGASATSSTLVASRRSPGTRVSARLSHQIAGVARRASAPGSVNGSMLARPSSRTR